MDNIIDIKDHESIIEGFSQNTRVFDKIRNRSGKVFTYEMYLEKSREKDYFIIIYFVEFDNNPGIIELIKDSYLEKISDEKVKKITEIK